MNRDEAIEKLQALAPEARSRFGMAGLWLFGSLARDEAKDASDIDVFVEFSEPPTLERFMGLKFLLEEGLGIRVDLGTRKALHPRLRTRIEREAIHVA